ncbi:ectonucleotide pyrophosphatase/phosphodiesterase family member 3-like [Penaeus chinensis]|uniref:ectonucleotide pyrophosphatase/phosphodiesterase family member 3-like n=1 Tax=Penaeus chinensis TaxID=139456 RepID=UPI001FB850AA|nr:ectonucleotide pyrophosphatase/phosphodiesterase family member 3-like [Penaeus chinensis]
MVQLVQGLSERQLLHCVNMIVLSDHGMAAAGKDRVIDLQEYVPELEDVALAYFGAVGMFSLKDDNDDMRHEIMSNLSCKRPDMRVYSPADLPKRFHFSNNRRISDVIVNLDAGKTVTTNSSSFLGGHHGYDYYFKEMRALFVAYGPDLQQGLEIEPFQNIELYNLMCQLTGVEPAENNGTFGALNHALAQPPPTQQLQQEVKPPSLSLPAGDVSDRLVASRCEGDSAAAQKWLSSLNLTQTQELELEEYHLPWGVPHTGNLPLSLKLLLHHDHVTGYSEKLRMPLWTSFTVKEGFPGTSGASWTADVRLASTAAPSCPELREFAGQGFAAEPLFPPAFSRNTSLPEVPFLTSNALAMSPSLAKRWKGLLEELVPAWVSAHGTLNVVLGPIFDNDTDSLLDDISRLRSPDIPSDLFAIVTRCKKHVKSLNLCLPDQLDSLSFIFSQSQSVSNCLTTERYTLEFSGRVKDVEMATGLVFFPSLTFRDRLRVLLRTNSVLWSTV